MWRNNYFWDVLTHLLFAFSKCMSRVWDPEKLGSVKSYWFKGFSVVNNCNALTCPFIAYLLVFTEYYAITHDVLFSNFQRASTLHLLYITAIFGMVHVWKVKVLRSVYKVKVLEFSGYTLYELIEKVELTARHRLRHVLGNALAFVVLLNKCVIARKFIIQKSFFVNKKEHGSNWLLSVLVDRVCGWIAFTIVAQYFEVNNSRLDEFGVTI